MAADPIVASPALPRPWGLLGTIAWVAVACFVALLPDVLAPLTARDPPNPDALEFQPPTTYALLLLAFGIATDAASIAIVAFAAHWRGWRVRDYLALGAPRRSEIEFGLSSMAALVIAFNLLMLGAGRDVVPAIAVESYQSIRAFPALMPLVIAWIVIGATAQDVMFRGFMFRGLSASFLGGAGTVLVTSAAWTAIHFEFDWTTLVLVFLLGLLLGWLRWASGSSLLTIMLHVVSNLALLAQAAIKVEWMTWPGS